MSTKKSTELSSTPFIRKQKRGGKATRVPEIPKFGFFRKYFTVFFGFSYILYLANDTGNISRDEVWNGSFAVQLGLVLLVNIALFLAYFWTRKPKLSSVKSLRVKETLIFFVVVGVNVGIFIAGFCQYDVTSTHEFRNGILLMGEFMWMYLLLSCYLTEWFLRILAFFVPWLLFLIVRAVENSLTAGEYVNFFRVLVCVSLAIVIQDNFCKAKTMEKEIAEQNCASLKGLFEQSESNLVIQSLDQKVKYSHVVGLSTYFNALETATIQKFQELTTGLIAKDAQLLAKEHPLLSKRLPNYSNIQNFIDDLTNDSELYAEMCSHRGKYIWFESILKHSGHLQQQYLDVGFSLVTFDNSDCIAMITKDKSQSIHHMLQINELQLNLLSSVSHELRTPLNGNINSLDRANESSLIPESAKTEFIRPALANARILSYFVNDVLDYLQLRRNELRLIPWRSQLYAAMQECADLFRFSVGKKGLELTIDFTEIEDHNYTISTDFTKMKQILINLISNAIKYTSKGSIKLIVSWEKIGKVVRISVKDSGIGMSEQEIERLKFKIANHMFTVKVNSNSTGGALGLVISNSLAKLLYPAQEQNLGIFSVQGEGSVFSFLVEDLSQQGVHRKLSDIINLNMLVADEGHKQITFPQHKKFSRMNSEKKKPRSSNTSNFDPKLNFGILHSFRTERMLPKIKEKCVIEEELCNCPKIMVVDDDGFNLNAIEGILRSLDKTYDIAYHGREALEKIQKQNENPCSEKCRGFSLVIMDCNMPIMNGFEATRIIREKIGKFEWRPLTVIGCTAYEDNEKLQECLRCGMDEYVKKPVTKKLIQDLLKFYRV